MELAPGLLRMLADARAGKFDVTLVWGEVDMKGGYLRRGPAGSEDTTALTNLENWEDKARLYLEELRLGLAELKDASLETKEERRR